MRFELDSAMCDDFKTGAKLRFGVDHDHYRYEVAIADSVRIALAADLD
jgi:hypothetical protein